MTAKHQRAETPAASESLVLETFSREAPMMAERANHCALEQRAAVDRRLRNRLIIANAITWIAIAVLIRFIFF
jgi:hypothetical protein